MNVGGKLDIVCFDKTGTLTEDGLDVLGLRVVHRPAMRYFTWFYCENNTEKSYRFSDLLSHPSTVLPGASFDRDPTIDYEIHKAALFTMATCHSLRLVDDQIVGDPLDHKMFSFTGWSLEEGGRRLAQREDDEACTLSPAVVRPPADVQYETCGQLDSIMVSLVV